MQIYDPSARKAKAGSLCLTDKGERLSQVTQGWPHPHTGVHITCIHIHRSERQEKSLRPTVFLLAQPGALCPSVSLQPLPPGPPVSRKLSFLRCQGKNGPVSYPIVM